jgi:hypothetical protein
MEMKSASSSANGRIVISALTSTSRPFDALAAAPSGHRYRAPFKRSKEILSNKPRREDRCDVDRIDRAVARTEAVQGSASDHVTEGAGNAFSRPTSRSGVFSLFAARANQLRE